MVSVDVPVRQVPIEDSLVIMEMDLLTLGMHAQEGYCSRPVCVCVCRSVKSHLTSGASVRLENTVTYSAGNGGQKICGVFSETAPLRRSSTPPLKAIHLVGLFSVESARGHYSISMPRALHFSAFI